jgi:branched-chain amino acid transport system ATP-binding protein
MLKAEGQSIVVVDKNLDALSQVCDRHYVLEKGSVVWSGSSEDLEKDRRAVHGYMGV